MPETRARDLANLAGAGATSSTVAYHETARSFTLPAGVGEANQVISSDGDGTTQWKTTLSAPEITSVTSDKGVNEYDSDGDDGAVIVINGTNLGADASDLTVEISTDNFVTTVQTSTISILSNGIQIQATFDGTETNYNTINAGETVKVKVTKSALQSAQSATLSGTVTGDPTFSTTSTTASTHTGTLAATSLGNYGGQVAGGGDDSNTKLLLNFDRTGGTDIEDSSNSGGDGHKVTATNAVIKASPFGDGKSAMYFDGSDDYINVPASDDWNFSNTDVTFEFWMKTDDVTNVNVIMSSYHDTNNNIAFYTYQSKLVFEDKRSNSHSGRQYQSGADLKTNTWQHIAVVYDTSATTMAIYIDGKYSYTSGSSFSSLIDASSRALQFGGQSNASNYQYSGYLDEIRIVKGTAVYTGDFDVPTSRLSATQSNQGTNIADITGTATKFLIHSNQESIPHGANFTIAHSATTQFATTNLSGLTGSTGNLLISENAVNGCGLSFPTSCNFDYGTDDFVIEWWYRGDFTHDWLGFYSAGGRGANSLPEGNACYVDQNNYQIKWGYCDSSGNNHEWCDYTGDSTTLASNTWIHIALVKDSTSYRMYIGGTQRGSTTTTGSATNFSATAGAYNSAKNFIIGSMHDQHENVGAAVGQMDNFRISQGTNRGYTGSSITVPTAIFTTDQYTKLLENLNNGAFTDSATGTGFTTHTITPTGAYHSQGHGGIAPAMTFPASGKLTGSAGMYFDGSSYIEVADSNDLDLGNGDFTIDFWLYHTGQFPTSPQTVFQKWSSYKSYSVRFDTNLNKLEFVADHDGSHGGAWDEEIEFNNTGITANTWYHIAFTKDSSELVLYVNGKYIGNSTALVGDTLNSTTDPLQIGNGDYKLYGYIDQFRLSKSRRYTGTSTASDWANFDQPTKIYGAYRSQDVGTIQLNATAGTGGGALDYAELSGGTALSTYGLSLSSSGAITGTLTGLAENSNSGGVIRIRARANADDNRVTTLGGSSFTGITLNDGKAPVLFNARRYVGTGSTRDINNFGFAPDLLWIKNRDATKHHRIVDSLRGSSKVLISNETNAESTQTTMVTALNSDGFSVGSSDNVNSDTEGMIAWGWKAGGAPSGTLAGSGATASLTNGVGNGTIHNNATGVLNCTNLTQSVNQNSGFSITKFTGSDTNDIRIPHNLGATPDWIMIKNLTSGEFWSVWHSGMDNSAGHYLKLNDDIAETIGDSSPYNIFPTEPDSTLVYGGGEDSNGGKANNDFIMYAWTAVSGVSAFGSHTSQITSVSGTTVGQNGYCGFKPRFVMIKNIDTANPWVMFDSFRTGTDLMNVYLKANESSADSSPHSTIQVTATSNGFTTGGHQAVAGNSSDKYISIAFA